LQKKNNNFADEKIKFAVKNNNFADEKNNFAAKRISLLPKK